MNILGISAFYHDSAAALLRDGKLVAAAQEERFTRKKHDERFPSHSVRFCLEQGGLSLQDLEAIIFYEKPFLKFERLLHTYLAYAPFGFKSFYKAMKSWMGGKLFLRDQIRKELACLQGIPLALIDSSKPKILFSEHHESHGASAFFPSPFSSAAVLTMDGVGEWATTSIGIGKDSKYEILKEIHFPHSLGLSYTAFTYYLGFKVNSGEYKVMGLAPYGTPRYASIIREHLIELRDDGSFCLNMDYFNYAVGLTMTHQRFHRLFELPPRKPESEITQKHMDIAASIQDVLEEAMLRLAQVAHRVTGEENLCMAGGVALNCVGNGKILREGPFKRIWIQPAAGDAGGAVGAAYIAWHHYFGKERTISGQDKMRGAFLGPAFSEQSLESFLKSHGIPYERLNDENLFQRVVRVLEEGAVVGWFQGAMEFGPRALGNRSILGNPCRDETQSVMNLKIKFRESFRPFAPAIMEEDLSEFFELGVQSPYMLLVAPVVQKRRTNGYDASHLLGLDRLHQKRSDIPAVTHVDYSARVQTVSKQENARFHQLLDRFKQKTGYPLLVNTSFNVRGEPIVCSPEDAYRCFMKTQMEYLVLGNFLLKKTDQNNVNFTAAKEELLSLD